MGNKGGYGVEEPTDITLPDDLQLAMLQFFLQCQQQKQTSHIAIQQDGGGK
jgi:hypothetical protein